MQVPASQAVIGAIHAWKSAESLLDAAVSLMKHGIVGPAVATSVLSFEESSKAIALVGHGATESGNGEFLRSVFTQHVTKQALGTYASSTLNRAFADQGLRFKGSDPSFTPEFVEESLNRFERMAEQLKQRGLYVDYQQGKWVTPDQLTQEDFNLCFLAATVNLLVAKSLLPGELTDAAQPVGRAGSA